MRRMVITKLLLVPVLLLGTTGCQFSFGHFRGTIVDGVRVSNGSVTMDGVRLRYDRWVDVDLSVADTSSLKISTATEELTLSGVAGDSIQVEVLLYSEHEGDGRVVIEGGKLKPVSDTGKVFINAVRGTVPARLELVLSTGTGSVSVDAMSNQGMLKISSGTGPVSVVKSTVGSVDVEMGTSVIRLDEVNAKRIDVETGTGDLRVTGGGAVSLEVDTGTGEVYVTNARFETISVDSGTGDVVLKDCTVGRVEVDSGTGDLILRGGQYDAADLDSGTGNLRIKDGAVVGVRRES